MGDALNNASNKEQRQTISYIPAAALKRFADDLTHSGVGGKTNKFLQVNRERVHNFIEKSQNVSSTSGPVRSEESSKSSTFVAGIHSYDFHNESTNSFLKLQKLPEFQASLGPRSRFGEGDGSFFDRWLNADTISSSHLYDKDGFPLMRFALNEVKSGFKRHIKDFKETSKSYSSDKQEYYVKPYAQRRQERLERERREREAQQAKDSTFTTHPSSHAESPNKLKPQVLASEEDVPAIAAQLTTIERENYFGPEARATFFEYYHHLSRQRFSNNPQDLMKQPTAPATARSNITEEDYLESEYVSTAPVTARPIAFAPKKFQFKESLFEDSSNNKEAKDIPDHLSASKDDTYSWLKIHEDRQTDEERKILLDQLLSSQKGSIDSSSASVSSTRSLKEKGIDRPLSARTRFLKGCVNHGVLPHPSLILRKDVTAMLNLASLGMGNEMAVLLADALDSLPLLVGLSVADNNLSDVGLVPIVNKLAYCKQLRLFDLSNNKVDSLTADALRKFLSSSACHLVVLRMENANVDDYEASLFMDALSVRQSVKELDLCHNLLGSHEFTVGKARRTGGEAIGAMLRSPSCAIQILKLAWNMIRFESAKALVSSIQFNQTLTYLDLSYNHLGVEGGEILGDSLHDNRTLRVLKLAHNNLTARPVLVIFAGVKSCTTLKELDISENPIGEEGARGLLSLNITHGDRIKITIKNCSVRITDPHCWFEPFSPKGEYELDLSNYYQRSIYFELLHIIARDKDLQISQLVYTPPPPSPATGFTEGPQEIQLQLFVEARSDEDIAQSNPTYTHGSSQRYDEVDIAEFGLDSGIANRLNLNQYTKSTVLRRNSYTTAALNKSDSYLKNQIVAETIKNDINSIREVFRETSNRIFEQYDTDHSGWLDREELAYILEQLGLHGSHHLVDKLFTMYDTDQSGKVEEEEFISFLLDIKKSLEKDNFFHTTHRYLYHPQDPRNSQVSFVYQINPSNDYYYLEYTGPKPVPYQPPREGKVSLIVAAYSRQSVEIENAGTAGNSSLMPEQQSKQMEAYLAASKTLSEGLTLFEFALEATKWTINEARTFYKMMIKELGSPIQVLVKLLPHMATPLDSRMLIADVLNHDFQQMQTLKYLLGSLYRVYVGLYNGFYSLQLSEPNDRQTFLLLADINELSKKKRQSCGRGDTSQYGDWQCFRNTSFDNAAILITDDWIESLPEKGRLEFDFVLLDNDHFRLKHKEISNLRLFRLLVSLGLIDETKRRRMFQKLQTNENDGRESARGLGNKKAETLPNAGRLIAEYLELLYDGFVFKRVTRASAIELTKEESFLLDDAKRRKKMAASNGGGVAGASNNTTTNNTARSDLNLGSLPPINEGITVPSTTSAPTTGRRTINKGGKSQSNNNEGNNPPPLSRTKNVNFNTAANTSHPATSANQKPGNIYTGPVTVGGIGVTELISADIYGHHIKEMIHEYQSLRSNNNHNPMAFMSNIDPTMIAARVLDALETILIARYLTCAQLGLLLEKFPHGNLLLNDYSTYRVELVISLFSRIIDLINFEYVFKELETFEIAMLLFRLGYLNLWNSMKPEGKIYLNLSRLEERKIAKILTILNYVEKGDTWVNPNYQETSILDYNKTPTPEQVEPTTAAIASGPAPETKTSEVLSEGEKLTEAKSSSRPTTAADSENKTESAPVEVEKWTLPHTWYTEEGFPWHGILSLQYFSGKAKQIDNCEPNIPFRAAFMAYVLATPYEDDLRILKVDNTIHFLEELTADQGILLSVHPKEDENDPKKFHQLYVRTTSRAMREETDAASILRSRSNAEDEAKKGEEF